ncbi:MAG: hypothetical protein CL878_03565 [Dehalococcoidia bacterium]|nr:hypothetical protein [Dehalococcoidia bacterium]
MPESNLTRPFKRRTAVQTINSRHRFRRHPHLVAVPAATYPDQVGVSDPTSIRLPRDCVYWAISMDVCPSTSRGWYWDRSPAGHLTLTALERASGYLTPAEFETPWRHQHVDLGGMHPQSARPCPA